MSEGCVNFVVPLPVRSRANCLLLVPAGELAVGARHGTSAHVGSAGAGGVKPRPTQGLMEMR